MTFNQDFKSSHLNIYNCLRLAQVNNLDIFDCNTGYICFELTIEQLNEIDVIPKRLDRDMVLATFPYSNNPNCTIQVYPIVISEIRQNGSTTGYKFMVYRSLAYNLSPLSGGV